MNNKLVKIHTKLSSLQSERLELKQLSIKDTALVLDYLKFNFSHFKPWIPDYGEDYLTLQYQERLMKAYEKKTKSQELVKFWIFEADDFNNSRIIGDITFSNIIWGAMKGCHVGYRMDRDFLNEGYMTEALGKAIEFMFKVYKLHRIEANIMPFNQHSILLIEKVGFVKEGFSPNYLRINGRWENHIRYGLINHELEQEELAQRANQSYVLTEK